MSAGKPLAFNYNDYIKAKEEIKRLTAELAECKATLCGKCGGSIQDACRDCRWRK